jgi:ATP-binding protein involved in chromosome partitioning
MDPRLSAVEHRLAPIQRILAVTGGKGGIGKSSVASVVALLLQREGLRTALLDLDLTSPSVPVILGAGECAPTEEYGVEPPRVDGIELMSIAWFLKEHAAPLRGDDVTNALLEILAVTRWQPADVLVVDMPPGLGDVALDAARWLPRAEYLVVAGSSRVVLPTVRRMLRLLTGLSAPIAGVVENMSRGEPDAVRALAREFHVPFLGTLPWDEELEPATGDRARLERTAFAKALRELVRRLRLSG